MGKRLELSNGISLIHSHSTLTEDFEDFLSLPMNSQLLENYLSRLSQTLHFR